MNVHAFHHPRPIGISQCAVRLIFSDIERAVWFAASCFILLISLQIGSAANFSPATSEAQLQGLLRQGVSSASIMGLDSHGVPLVCGCGVEGGSGEKTALMDVSPAKKPAPTPPPPVLPSDARMWEAIPGVIRDNGTDTFRLEVNANGAVSNVALSLWPGIVSESGQTNLLLRDDGLDGDRTANDFIYTSELLQFDTNNSWVENQFYNADTNSPVGVSILDIGPLTVTETNGQQTSFLVAPQVGLLNANIPLVKSVALSSNVLISPHLINVLGTNLSVQKFVRGSTSASADLAKILYVNVPDAFDFLIEFSTYRMEYLPYNSGANFNAGVQWPVQVNFTGTGQAVFNNTATYGSAGRLLATVGLDAYQRGILSYNCTHEILHEWGSYIPAMPISDGQHYVSRSSVASLLGGQLWETNGDGTWTLNCQEGRNGATHLDPLDKYMMGLIPGNQVPMLRTYPQSDPEPLFICGSIISNVQYTVTSADIAAYYGPRSPGPSDAKRDFSLGFVAESNQRLLNPVEMTFYDMLAAHYTRMLPSEASDPYVGFNWAPITRFFGEGTSWRSEVLSLFAPAILDLKSSGEGKVTIDARGLSGRTYELQASPDIQTWTTITNQTAGADGTITFTDSAPQTGAAQFYRLAWP